MSEDGTANSLRLSSPENGKAEYRTRFGLDCPNSDHPRTGGRRTRQTSIETPDATPARGCIILAMACGSPPRAPPPADRLGGIIFTRGPTRPTTRRARALSTVSTDHPSQIIAMHPQDTRGRARRPRAAANRISHTTQRTPVIVQRHHIRATSPQLLQMHTHAHNDMHATHADRTTHAKRTGGTGGGGISRLTAPAHHHTRTACCGSGGRVLSGSIPSQLASTRTLLL